MEISAATRDHPENPTTNPPPHPQPQDMVYSILGLFKTISLILLAGVLAWAYQATQPPPAKVCGSPGGPPVIAPRIKLKDGRHLAYKEHGVPKENASYKIIYIHALGSCRNDFVYLSKGFAEDHGIYAVSYDRAGYGESEPNPKQTVKSAALDIEELADQLELGSKFYVMGESLGGQIVWSCLKFIPHRLLGASLLTPAINYWWPGFPAKLSEEAYKQLLVRDQWAFRVAHYIPWLTYWWNTQKWFPVSSFISVSPEIFSQADRALFTKAAFELGDQSSQSCLSATQQSDYESRFRDLMNFCGKWEFDPMDLENPFPNNEGSIHLWQGDQDLIVPVILQRYIAQQLPWVQYHEVPDAGHMFPHIEGMDETLLKVLLGK